jgi:hypothetical protein
MLIQAITAQQRHQAAQATTIQRKIVTDEADKLGIEYGTAYKYRRHEVRRMRSNGSI